jgi:type IV pilus secretin PilQ/predicted competence protein
MNTQNLYRRMFCFLSRLLVGLVLTSSCSTSQQNSAVKDQVNVQLDQSEQLDQQNSNSIDQEAQGNVQSNSTDMEGSQQNSEQQAENYDEDAVNQGASINNVVLDDPLVTDAPLVSNSSDLDSPINSSTEGLPLNSGVQTPSSNIALNSSIPQATPTNGNVPAPSQNSMQNPVQNSVQETPAMNSVNTQVVDLGPPVGKIYWVGYSYNRPGKVLDVQIVTEGKPIYKIFQSTNRANQTEIVLRFLNTNIRSKIRRDIDATEFRSPVAYIRIKRDEVFAHSDVILTLRDPVKPSMKVVGSNVMLSFPIPERWYQSPDEATTPVAQAEVASDADVLPVLEVGSDAERFTAKAIIKPYVDDPGKDTFSSPKMLDVGQLTTKPDSNELVPVSNSTGLQNAPVGNGVSNPLMLETPNQPANESKNVVPGGFGQRAVQNSNHKLAWSVSSFFVAAVAQAAPPLNGMAVTDDSMMGNVNQAQDTVGENLNQEQSEAASSGPSKKLIRFDFRNSNVGAVMRAISNESGLNFVMSESIAAKKISISLTNIPWDVALKSVLESNRLGMEEIAPRVVSIDELKSFSDDRDAIEKAKQSTEALVPTKVMVMKLSYSNAKDTAALIEKMLPRPAAAGDNPVQKRSYERYKVLADERSNSIIVEAIPTELAKIKALIERIDTQTPQVKISSRIVEVVSRVEKNLGIKWGTAFNFDAGRGLGFGTLPFPNSISSGFAIDPGFKGSAVGVGDITFGSINNLLALDLKIRMLEARSEAESLQNQDILVEDNQEANIVAGTSDYILVPGSGTGGSTLAEIEYNTSLKVKPHITADGAVQMKVEITGNEARASSNKEAAAGKIRRTLNTTLIKKSGETAVIGGLYTTLREKVTSGVPWLSSIPVIGALFRMNYSADNKRDLIIMLTPSIQSMSSVAGGDNGMTSEEVAPAEAPLNVSVNSSVPINQEAVDQSNQQSSSEEDVQSVSDME